MERAAKKIGLKEIWNRGLCNHLLMVFLCFHNILNLNVLLPQEVNSFLSMC